MLSSLLWASLIISVLTSLIRAFNIGFLRETYVLSALSLIPIIYDLIIHDGTIQIILFNIFHFGVAVLGVYRWWNTSTKRTMYETNTFGDTSIDKDLQIHIKSN